ncbi:hypothetical protein GE09DRAFT_688208 [Coniochaeta sp. 2T2.1]|nr:hypothetical protein GE09DRAFT_688208 [Coniochaeta sp. 2T2.1]
MYELGDLGETRKYLRYLLLDVGLLRLLGEFDGKTRDVETGGVDNLEQTRLPMGIFKAMSVCSLLIRGASACYLLLLPLRGRKRRQRRLAPSSTDSFFGGSREVGYQQALGVAELVVAFGMDARCQVSIASQNSSVSHPSRRTQHGLRPGTKYPVSWQCPRHITFLTVEYSGL